MNEYPYCCISGCPFMVCVRLSDRYCNPHFVLFYGGHAVNKYDLEDLNLQAMQK